MPASCAHNVGKVVGDMADVHELLFERFGSVCRQFYSLVATVLPAPRGALLLPTRAASLRLSEPVQHALAQPLAVPVPSMDSEEQMGAHLKHLWLL